ncbi:RNA polymerase sigma-70 factor [Microbacterium sp.]|uniref:RNA polymerase sigma-70 factor n=1 Tax=Microbacterium sp. TaxID=51671 RepID=UPI002D79D041|nr:RNA polymerase sigma-70 factor [Microbacterium sp.]HET6302954.1 RNA polymerase sigma-70 factor [Microbacterium sp.]
MNTGPGGVAQIDADALELFEHARGRLFGIAYRMLGSAADAEDVVQETWLRWQQCDRAAVREPDAFLATTATRIAINVLHSARVRRETYIGPWLPSPVDTANDPTLGAERGEALRLATLLLMERLGPTERAAYVLREAFDYPYARIAEIVETTEVAARQLVSRARKHLAAGGGRAVAASAHRRFFEAFLRAARSGDAESLEVLLAEDAVSYTDGGGVMRRTARRPILGREKLVRFLLGVSRWFWGDVSIEVIQVNGLAAALLRRADRIFAVLTVTIQANAVSQVMWMMNPVKLAEVVAIHERAHEIPSRLVNSALVTS